MRLKNTFIIGFAIFAMLFGAGNLVFPPYLGMHSRSSWLYGFAGYAVMDIVFAMIAMIIIASKNDVNSIVRILGNKPSKILMFLVYICLGPLIAIPRTAATTYGLTVETLFPDINSIVFSIVFFAVVLVISIKPSKIIDIIGALLAPVLLITIGILVIKGIITPVGTVIQNDSIFASVKEGIMAGYQTMDTIAMLVFSIIIVNKIKDHQLENEEEEQKMMRNSCYIAGIALGLIYAGLTYLGATASSVYPSDSNRTFIIVNLAKDILGSYGFITLAIIVAFACITTAVGLVSSCASYFNRLTNQKFSYKTLCILICIFSATICNAGLENIIAFAAPILDFIYPIVLLLIALSVADEKSISTIARYGSIIGVVFFVIMQMIENLLPITKFTTQLPFATYGFAWITPAVLGLLIGVLTNKIKKSNHNKI